MSRFIDSLSGTKSLAVEDAKPMFCWLWTKHEDLANHIVGVDGCGLYSILRTQQCARDRSANLRSRKQLSLEELCSLEESGSASCALAEAISLALLLPANLW